MAYNINTTNYEITQTKNSTTMANGIVDFEKATGVFAGQGDLVIFDPITDYSTASFATLANPKSLGQIVQDSTSWEGEDPETTQIKDEQGDLITARVTAGTLGFSFELASTSLDMVKKFLNGADVTVAANAAIAAGTVKAVGFGVDLPVMTVPYMILNDECTRAWLYPKGKTVGNLSWADGLWRIKASVTCEYLKTKELYTGMILDLGGKANYGAAE